MKRLLNILSIKRPHGDPWEQEFVEHFIVKPLEALGLAPRREGPMENIVVVVPGTGNGPTNEKILFSCHTDTVHTKGGKQVVVSDLEMGQAYKNDNEPLGADDGTGVWLMLEMIAAAIPGTYAFHRGEERGCIGSKWMAENRKDWLKTFDIAVAFDRKDEDNVITFQRSRRTCSDAFAAALAKELNTANKHFRYKPDPTGVYTDTASYAAHIKECTNISVGYQGAHGGGETQDLHFAVALRDALLKVDWEKLPATREAKEESYDYQGYQNSHGSFGRQEDLWSRKSGTHAAGYSAQPFLAGAAGGMYNSSSAAASAVATQLGTTSSARKVAGYCKEIIDRPPITMQDLIYNPEYHSDMIEYCKALMMMEPERAILVMRQGMLYFQAYRLMLQELENSLDQGQLGMRPCLTKLLREKYEPMHVGLLVKKAAPAAAPFKPAPMTDEEVKKTRELRKAAKKAKKEAKRAKKGGGASGARTFQHPETGVVTRPSPNPQADVTPSRSDSVIPVLTLVRGVPSLMQPLIPISTSTAGANPQLGSGPGNDYYAG